MRMEYVVVSIILALVVLLTLIIFGGNIIPIFKQGIKSLGQLVGIKVESI